jgi:competence protein ComEA
MRRVICTFTLCLFAAWTQVHGAEWTRLDGCELVPNESNDGDSFHVEQDGKEYIFRLYFADCPESSMQVADRVTEQAEEFGVKESAVLKAGKDAAKFTEKALRRPFTVTTRFQNARGASNLPRSYATVRTAEGKDLGSLLVEAGLARAHGVAADVPRAPSMSDYKRMEIRARREGYGIFGGRRIAQEQSMEPEAPIKEEESTAPPKEEFSVTDAAFARLAEADPIAPLPVKIVEPGIFPSGHQSSADDPPAKEPVTAVPSPSEVGKRLSINTATKQELEALPRIGPKTAEAIIEARPFGSVHELLRVKGIGPVTFDAIAPLITE